ncbi:uncharacterized protein [Cicer arietinum]|uniref:uncharacterized protein n=1 Tax=Cicer arietinum TaxID=3827 RepID=UPI003CC6A04E
MRCNDGQKVDLAVYMLESDAEHWWNCARGETEFLNLLQGGMSVVEYVAKFEALSRYSHYLRDNPQDEWKAIKFEQGLRPELQRFIGILEIRDYPTLVNKSRVAEKKMQALEAEKLKEKFNPVGKRCCKSEGQARSRPQNQGRVFTLQGEEVKESDGLIKVINCSDKSILVAPQPRAIDSPHSSKCFVSALACHRYLVEGAQGYMLLFSSKVEVEDNLTLMPVVGEFLDVFPNDVSSLPPNRELEFSIDLVPGCGPVSVAPYRMSALELKELKKQL